MRNQSSQLLDDDRPKRAPSSGDEPLQKEEELAAGSGVSPKTLASPSPEGGQVTGNPISAGSLSVRYRLSEVIAFEQQDSVRSTSGGDE